MFSVALIGPDGAGKTTVGLQLANTLPLPVKYLYMGVSADSSNKMLPTTRLIRAIKKAAGAPPDTGGPPDPLQSSRRPKGKVKGLLSGLRAILRLVNRLSEEWYRQALAWFYQSRGQVVLFDRHYFSDYHAYDIADHGQERPLTRRIHGTILEHFYPQPDLVIYLDAPGQVLFDRKGEGSVAALERRRQDYFQLRSVVKHFVVVDATQPLEVVTGEVTQAIWNFYLGQARRSPQVKPVSPPDFGNH